MSIKESGNCYSCRAGRLVYYQDRQGKYIPIYASRYCEKDGAMRGDCAKNDCVRWER